MIFPVRLLKDWLRVIGIRVLLIWVCAVVVFQCIDVFEHLRDYTQAGASTQQIAVHFVLRTPEIAFQILPAAILLGALIGLFYLAKNKELTAAEASGLHPGWIYAAPLLIGLGLSGLQLWLETGPLPRLRETADRYYAERIERNPLRIEEPVRWTTVAGDLWRLESVTEESFYVERYSRRVQQLDFIRIKGLKAAGGSWSYDSAEKISYPAALTPQAAGKIKIPFLPEEMQPVRPKSRHEPLGELLRLAREKKSLTGEVSQLLLEVHQRLSWALMSFTVLLAILPFVPRHGRQASTATGVLTALVIGLIGWTTIVMGTALATTEKNIAGFWLPHLFLLLTGIVGSTRIRHLFQRNA